MKCLCKFKMYFARLVARTLQRVDPSFILTIVTFFSWLCTLIIAWHSPGQFSVIVIDIVQEESLIPIDSMLTFFFWVRLPIRLPERSWKILRRRRTTLRYILGHCTTNQES
ncbi:hypothetical protein K461DRAFT_35199 [Myriangium duriaei CBS 260.36]|uniref:Uncharacterized protein n=1 Tax=Myriangium duriaei CBS 260.36 TaxID=1168546 RepID=A0A9P4IW28_9PEZI|nr:hypothetical protein K461DRAFT_35199 [Myriangium duriaei CBS 260.36]